LQKYMGEVIDNLPVPKDGKDGTSVTIDEIRPLVAEAVEAIPKPKDGTSVTIDEVKPLVAEAVEALPKPKDGKDGTSVTLDDVQPMLRRMVDALPKPQDGKSVTIDDVRPLIAEAVEQFPKPKDGVDGKSFTEDEVKVLIENVVGRYVDKWALDFERRAHDLLQKVADSIPIPKDGKDGFGFDDFEEEYDGERTIIRRYKMGDRVKEFRHKMNMIIERGVHVKGKFYEKGDCVTWGGNYWTALVDTEKSPGDNNTDWRLVVRKGRDGKNGDRGPPGKVTVVNNSNGKGAQT
jgi:hypothetical protein